MPFTGILGGGSGTLGSIVLGLSVGFGPGSFGYKVHVLTSRTIRVAFDFKVDLSFALDPSNYVLSAVNPPTMAYIPSIVAAREYEEGGFEIELVLSESLTSGQVYVLQLLQIPSFDGSGVASAAAHNFTANVPDPPRAVGAYLSVRGCLDIVFDRPVGRFSPSPSAQLFDSSGGPGAAMVFIPWDASIPERNLRFTIPPAAPASQDWRVDYRAAADISLNLGDGSSPVTVPQHVTRPLTQAQSLQASITDAWSTGFNLTYGFCNIRVYFSCPMDVATTSNPANWTLSQVDTHRNTDTSNPVVAPNAVDLATLIVLCNALKASFNKHRTEPTVHFVNDVGNTVFSPPAFDAVSAVTLLMEIESRYIAHASSEPQHSASDPVNLFPFLQPDPLNIPGCCLIANSVKTAFNGHLAAEYILLAVSAPFLGPISSGFCPYASDFQSDEAVWHADIRATSSSPKASIRVRAAVSSEDLGSATNPFGPSGSAIARPASAPLNAFGISAFPDRSVSFKTDREVELRPSGSGVSLGIPEQDFAGPPVRRFTTLHAAFWALSELWIVYDRHRIAQFHPVTDVVNYMLPGDVPAPPLPSLLVSVNALRSKFLSHRTTPYHVHSDPTPFHAPPAFDAGSFIRLVEALCLAFDEHSTNAGMHGGSSMRWRSAPLFDAMELETLIVLNGWSYSVFADVESRVHDLRDQDFAVLSPTSISFLGLSTPPYIADAVPRSGLSQYDLQRRYLADEVQFFFSKPMGLGDLTSVSITGGSLIVKSRSWSTRTRAAAVVSDMQSIPYSISASGLKDVAGNQVP